MDSEVRERRRWVRAPYPPRDASARTTGSAFATSTFHRTWWEHYGRGRRPELSAVRRDDGSLAAILPLYRWRERPQAHTLST